MTISCDLLADNKVKDHSGEDLGRVEELVYHPDTGTVSHAIVSFGGFLGASDRMIVVPWQALDLDQRTRTFYLRADRQTLRHAPKLSRGEHEHLPGDYLATIDAHYLRPATHQAA